MQKGLTAFQLKLIAITAMLIDHLAWYYVDLDTGLGQLLHMVGRLTAPIMCFFIAEGYRHTRSLRRYAARLAVFALISQLPFTYYSLGRAALFPLNVIYTLLIGLLAIHCLETIPNESKRWGLIGLLLLLAVPADWSVVGVVLCLGFYSMSGDWPRLTALLAAASLAMMAGQAAWRMLNGYSFAWALHYSWFQGGVLLSVFLLRLYNGEKGGGPWSRWLFYLFYPLHQAVLAVLRWRF
ncbi:MAG: protein TraX [Firmicutes bacterium]|mgnify:CR=1 FL=1|nr:protein TraX [Bacillota bacterium]